VAGLRDAAMPLSEFDELIGLRKRGREWLLDQHVDAALHELPRYGEMRNGRNGHGCGLHAGCDQIISRTKSLRVEVFANRLGASVVEIGNTDEVYVLSRICLQVAINPRVIASEGAATDHSNPQCAAASWHSGIVAYRAVVSKAKTMTAAICGS